jgi:hypothetical protein
MSNDLDDAMRRLSALREAQRAEAAQRHEQAEERADLFVELVDDFLNRMRAAVHPGTTLDWPDGKHRKVRAWSLVYDDTDKLLELLLTVDGRVIHDEMVAKRDRHGRVKQYSRETELRSFWEATDGFGEKELQRLALSMAELLPQNPDAPSEPESP